MLNVFSRLESNVRSYSRAFPAVFDRAKGSMIWDEAGAEYIDLFSGAGSLNYGHNPDAIKHRLMQYIERDGIAHGLDMMTTAKAGFMADLQAIILKPRQLDYRFLFPGPAGNNAVEAALKIARKATGRSSVAAFTNGFHGMTLGALAATGSAFKRGGAGVPLAGIQRLPFDGYFGPGVDTIALIETLLTDPSSGVEPPAAFLLETIQGEGGVNAASADWLRRLAALARQHGILLIVDDIQAGCGRSGSFFSFDGIGIVPDIVCLSKSLSGYGLPLALVLLRPEFDVFQPGEHNGTFRGFNHAFVTASAALAYWQDAEFQAGLDRSVAQLDTFLAGMAARWGLPVRGRGLMRGLVMPSGEAAAQVSAEAFRQRVLIETSGGRGEVVKFLPALTIGADGLGTALERVGDAVAEAMRRHDGQSQPARHPAAA